MHISARFAFKSLILAVGGWAAYALQPPPQISSNQTLVVRIYDLAKLPPPEMKRVLRAAGEILSSAGEDVIWRRGTDEVEGHTQDLGVQTASLPAQDYRGYIVVSILQTAPEWFHAGALGYALPEARCGVNATIFFNRVERFGSGATDRANLLGQVMAHEIGHVLLGSTKHSNGGIMRAVWSNRDF